MSAGEDMKTPAPLCSAGGEGAQLLSQVQLSETPGTAARQAPPSMGFSRQEYWSGLPLSLHR